MAQINLVTCAQVGKGVKITGKEFSTMIKLDCQKNPNSDICDVGSSQAAIIDQDVGSSADTKHQNELNLKLWCFRANYIQEILSVPHEEHCPLYSYTRCKKLGINFNVGSGVKQKLDPKSLTNGIMVELNTFATALSSQKHVITEILDYNFHLDFDNEVYRSAFAQQMMDKVRVSHAKKRYRVPRMKMRFKLPDIKCIQQLAYMDKTAYCPKCYQDRSQKLRQDYSDPGHMHHPRLHTMVDTVSADANCTARKPAKDPSSSFSAIEKTIMDSYPGCKKIGLSLFVDKDQPKHKLDTCVLSHEIMWEVASFAKTFCGTKCKIIHEVLEHNFNLGMQRSDIAQLFRKAASLKDGGLTWFSEVFVISPISHRPLGYVGKVAREAAKQSVWKESIKNRKLALQMKKQRATLPSDNINVVKESETNHDCKVMKRAYPLCTEMGLDLDVTSKTGEKEKLELKLLTRAVVWEMHTFARKKPGKFLPHMVYDILDYNFDLSSQNHRCWEFSKATTSKIQSMIRGYHKLPHKVDKVFKLPFDFVSKSSQRIAKEMQNKKCTTNEGHFVRQVKYRSGVNRVYFLDGYKTKGACFHDEDTPFPTDPGTMVQMDGNQVNVGCGSHFQGNLQIKEEYDPSNGNVKPEPDTEEKHCVDYKTKKEACFHGEDTPFPTDPVTIVQMDGNEVNVGCGSPFRGNLQIKEEYDPSNGNVKPEPDTEEKCCLDDYKTKKEAWFHDQDTPFPTDPVTIVQMDGNEVNVGCGSPFQGNLQIKEEEYDPSNGNVKPEPDTEEKYSPLHDDVETESNTEEFVYIVPVDTAAFHEYLW
ncbi:uncharacterized protein LOC115028824 isoform X2 [Cottoperca gobio]|uniref:Uncharacterized protein LOC115028824 isoform X2 n=1 Tax=Cottoperca gobio TaxID=56716 RepID=A0A6J2S7D6_COTGO|nr:uncharacterized protein LOC115028824 isoform X2 [Cottoperca gobio]